MDELAKRLDAVEKTVLQILTIVRILSGNMQNQANYTAKEFAARVGKTIATVQDWCRRGRVNAKQIEAAAGDFSQWRISQKELERYQAEGLLSEDPERNR